MIGVDLYGPHQDKRVSGHARKTFKSWRLMVYYLGTGVVSMWACTGCDTRALLLTLSMHTSIYGMPLSLSQTRGVK